MPRLDEQLDGVDPWLPNKGNRQIDVQHVAEPGAGIADAQSDAYVRQHAERLFTGNIPAPGASGVSEHCRPDVEKVERKPVGIEALLDREQCARGAGLVTQRVPAQPIVSPSSN